VSQQYARDLGDEAREMRQSMQSGDGNPEMAERIARLEALVKSMAKQSESAFLAAEKGLSEISGTMEPQISLDVLQPSVLRPQLDIKDPILGLFDNHRVGFKNACLIHTDTAYR
jgi:hypothetical protein